MFEYENSIWDQGFDHIAGLDEVGRGCLFGDVVAAAVIMPKGLRIDGMNDSKKLSEKKRERLFDEIMATAVAIGVGSVDATTIDQINIKQASRLAMKRALEQLTVPPDYLLIDAERVETDLPQQAIIHGDALSHSIAAASIIAKVTRDRQCIQWDEQYPGYGIASHKGYASKTHRDQLLELGPSPLHRRSFLGKLLPLQQQLF